MRKIMIMMALAICVALGASARDRYVRDISVLPPAAKSAVQKHFKSDVNIIKLDGGKKYFEVILKDGSEVTFDRDGNWVNVEVGASKSVPDAFVPAGVKAYVQKQHKGERIVGIERERGGYEVDLSNGIEMKFDHNGNFVRYDR